MSRIRRKMTAALAAWALIVTLPGTPTAGVPAGAQRQPQTTTAARATARGFTQYVNTFVGTDNDGNTFPGATVPFGMVQWSPDTTAAGWYNYPDTKIRGFCLTRSEEHTSELQSHS